MSILARSEDFKSELCRLSYARGLFTPSAVTKGADEKYNATLIFPKTSKPALEKIVAKLIVEAWPNKGIERARAGMIRSPFLAGDGKEARNAKTGDINPGLGPEFFFIRVQSGKDKPVSVIWKSPNVQETETNVYSGCYGQAILNAFAWDHPTGGDGISFGISIFRKTAEGDRLAGGGPADPDKWFEKIEDVGDAPQETRNGGGASSLFGD